MLTGASIELKTCNAALLETTGKSWDEVGLFHSVIVLTFVLEYFPFTCYISTYCACLT